VANPDRKGGGGLSLRTLVIASAASLTAAMVSSRLFPPGTIYASALTPVIVAAVSEVLNRPVDRVSEFRRQRRTLVREVQRERVLTRESTPLVMPSLFADDPAGHEELGGNGNGNGEIPYTVHGRRRPITRRILHPKVWLVTGLAGFAIAVAVLTLPELVFGGAVATSRQTTFFGGGGSPSHTSTTKTQTSTTPSGTQTTTVTQTTPTPSQTQTTPAQTTPATTGTGTTPSSGGAPAPSSTGTSTTPAPGGAVTPGGTATP
jgi:hypothetical protein